MNPLRILKRLIGDLRNSAQSLAEIRAGIDNQSKQLDAGFSKIHAAIDRQSAIFQDASGRFAAAVDRLSDALAHSPDKAGAFGGPSGNGPDAPNSGINFGPSNSEAEDGVASVTSARLIANIAECGRQPFIQICVSSPSGHSFLNCLDQQDIDPFVDQLERSEYFSRSSFLKGLAKALRADFYGASEYFFDWIELGDATIRFKIIDLRKVDHGLAHSLELPAYHILVAESDGSDSHDSSSASSRALSLGAVISSYNRPDAGLARRWPIIEGASFGLVRYLASVGRADEAATWIDGVLRFAPKSIHMRAAQHALNLQVAGKPIPDRLAKFVGRDNGALRGVICAEPFRRFDVQPSGEVLVCCGHWLPKAIGNLMSGDADDILNSPSAKEIRSSVLDGSFRYCSHLECTAFIHNALPKKEEVTDPVLRRAIDHGDLGVQNIEQMQFGFDLSCNLSCPSCRSHVIVEKPSLSSAKADIVTTKIIPLLGGLRKLNINQAGEVFFSKPSRRILEAVSKDSCPDLHLDLISNGTLFSEREWRKFPNLEGMVRAVRISTDAARKETFEKLRRLGVWETFVENVRFLSRLRRSGEIKQLKFSFTYQRDNFLEMRDFVEFCRDLNADYAIFERLNLGAYSSDEFRARAVHLPEHERHGEFLGQISDPIFAAGDVWHDFEWECVAPRLPKFAQRNMHDLELGLKRPSF